MRIIMTALALNLGIAHVYGDEPVSPASQSPAEREAAASTADEAPPPASGASETIFHRPKLSGDWWGVRDVLSAHGIDLDVSLTQFYQGVTTGGKEQAFEYGGKVDYYLSIDSTRAGLWPGLNVVTHAETRYGEDINAIDGMFTFGNFNMAFPTAGETVTGVTALKVTQRLSDHFMLIAGKINSLDDFRLNFTGRNGRERFMNSAVVANIISARTIPYSTYGAGFAVFADKSPEFTFMVRDPDNHPTTSDLNRLFAHGALLTGVLRIPVAPRGLPGTQVIGGNWSSRNYTAVDPASYVNIPGQGIVAGKESGSWALYYNFDQYLWVSPANSNAGFGIFGMLGISDGNPNPVRWNTTIGIGANALVPGREHDTFGAAYFHIGLSDDFKDLLSAPVAPPGIEQRDEQGVELFYNAALAPWCRLTADLQIVEPSTKNLHTTVLAGMRLKIDF
jgi:porin